MKRYRTSRAVVRQRNGWKSRKGSQHEADRVAVLRHQEASREAGVRISEYVRQAVISAEVTPRLNRQDADAIRKLVGKPTTSTSWRIGQMPEVLHWWRWNW